MSISPEAGPPELPMISPPSCLKAMEVRVVGEDSVTASFCKYSGVMVELVQEGTDVRVECFEDCPHTATFGTDESGRVVVGDQSYNTAA